MSNSNLMRKCEKKHIKQNKKVGQEINFPLHSVVTFFSWLSMLKASITHIIYSFTAWFHVQSKNMHYRIWISPAMTWKQAVPCRSLQAGFKKHSTNAGQGEIALYAVREKKVTLKQRATSLKARGNLNWCRRYDAELGKSHGAVWDGK